MSEYDIQECISWLLETSDNHNISTAQIERVATMARIGLLVESGTHFVAEKAKDHGPNCGCTSCT